MASCSSLPARLAAPLVLPVFVWGLVLALGWSPAQGVGQDVPATTPNDPPTLRIPALDSTPAPAGEAGRRKHAPAADASADDTPAADARATGQPDPAREQIRRMLQGQAAPAETGDPILDGVMDVIRDQGSVLQGSSLDPAADAVPPGERRQPQPLPSNDGFPGDRGWIPGGPPPARAGFGGPSAGQSTADNTARFLLAEQLLRTARLLAAQPYQDAARQQLIGALRSEAARCLSGDRPTPPSYDTVPAGHTDSY